MARLWGLGLSVSTVTNMISQAIAGLPAYPLAFVNNGAFMTLAQLYTNYPPSAANANARDVNAAADCTFLGANASEGQVNLAATGAAGTSVGNSIRIHLTAFADF